MPDKKKPPRDWDKGFGDNAGHGAEKVPCSECKFRRIITTAEGRVIDTGRGATCKKFPVLKPMEVMKDGADCPQFEKDGK